MSTRMTGGALRKRPAASPTSERKTLMTNHVKVIAVLTARAGAADQLRALLDGLLSPSRAEPGNLRYDLWQDQAEPTRFVLDELYVDADAVAAHRATPHFQAYLGSINDLAERVAYVLDPAAVARRARAIDDPWASRRTGGSGEPDVDRTGTDSGRPGPPTMKARSSA